MGESDGRDSENMGHPKRTVVDACMKVVEAEASQEMFHSHTTPWE